ncbi:MAG: hypothetical protein KDF49_05915, partial [Nitrosomonas sp.]|nr:hypothetical protein [Nitrosomonas sp.]
LSWQYDFQVDKYRTCTQQDEQQPGQKHPAKYKPHQLRKKYSQSTTTIHPTKNMSRWQAQLVSPRGNITVQCPQICIQPRADWLAEQRQIIFINDFGRIHHLLLV